MAKAGWQTFRAARPEEAWPRQLMYLEIRGGVEVQDGLILANSYGWWDSIEAFTNAYAEHGEKLRDQRK